MEVIGTFVLSYIFLQTFAHPRSEHRAVGPLAVGLAYTAILTATAPYSSASLNPARTLGPAAVSGESGGLWIWIVGPIVGALHPRAHTRRAFPHHPQAQTRSVATCLRLATLVFSPMQWRTSSWRFPPATRSSHLQLHWHEAAIGR